MPNTLASMVKSDLDLSGFRLSEKIFEGPGMGAPAGTKSLLHALWNERTLELGVFLNQFGLSLPRSGKKSSRAVTSQWTRAGVASLVVGEHTFTRRNSMTAS